MGITIRERDIEAIEKKLATINTTLNKIIYLESAIKETGTSFEIKRYLYKKLTEHYEERKMFERAAKATANKAGIEITFREKIESYIQAAGLFAKAGKIEDAEDMFTRAKRDANIQQHTKITLARKNIYLTMAQEQEKKGRKATAAKYYEKIIKMDLEDIEKQQIKEKLQQTYKALGQFKEAKLLEGI